MLIQRIYIPILNYIYRFTKCFSDIFRQAMIYALISIIIVSSYFYQIDFFFGFSYSASINSIIGVISFIGIIVFSIDREIKTVRINSMLIYIMALCGLVVFLSGIHHYIGYSYMIMGLFMMFLVPPFVMVWRNRGDIDTIFDIFSLIFVISFVLYFMVNMAMMPYMEADVSGRYAGVAADPNGAAKTAVLACLCALYLFISCEKRIKFLLLPVLSVSIGMTILTVSRTNLLALAIILIFSILFVLKKIYNDKNRSFRKYIYYPLSIILVIILVPLFIYGYGMAKSVDTGNVIYVSEEKKVSEVIETRLTQGSDENNEVNINAASSGRIEIWKYCFDRVSLVGNDVSEGVIMIPETGRVNDHAHNTSIELMHRSGIFAGILFFFVELMCAAWIIKTLFIEKKAENYKLFPILAITAFGIASMFDIVVLPFAKPTVFAFYISIACVIFREKNGKAENS